MGPVYEVYMVATKTELMVDGKLTPISSGMSLTTEIKVGGTWTKGLK